MWMLRAQITSNSIGLKVWICSNKTDGMLKFPFLTTTYAEGLLYKTSNQLVHVQRNVNSI